MSDLKIGPVDELFVRKTPTGFTAFQGSHTLRTGGCVLYLDSDCWKDINKRMPYELFLRLGAGNRLGGRRR